ncbi:hypothetical protein lerEdw1_003225 [Lerista edwardsae]|nr:hypothetical protein lerEdw1_003225 [Lerista edwardsae]
MVMMTAWMVLMSTQRFALIIPVLIINLSAIIIAASPRGGFVMEQMIVATMKMNQMKPVQQEHVKQTSFPVQMDVAFQIRGCAIEKMTVVTNQMKWPLVNSQLVTLLLIIYAKMEDASVENGIVIQMMTVVMAVMNWIVFIHVLTISSDVPMVGVFQLIGLVMVIMTVETPVMKTNQTAQKKKQCLLEDVLGKNFNATLMETVFLNSGVVMERRIVKTAVMKSTVMELYAHVMREQNFLARPQPFSQDCSIRTGRCISKAWLCDGDIDCEDQSDEDNCEEYMCGPPKYPCANDTSICLQPEKLCNGRRDCPDGSDEDVLCDECSLNNGGCSHQCSVVPGGRIVCSCPLGLYLSSDNKTYPFEAFIIFSIRHEIRKIDLQKRDYSLLVPGLRNTIALDFHFNQSLLYWTDVVEDKIYRGKLSETGGVSSIEVIVQHGLATPEGLTVDWIAGNIYWIDSNLDQIEVAKLDGTLRTTLIAGAMEHPRAIALDPRYGILFWTDWDANFPRIESASMSGAGRRIIYKDMDSGAWPNGLTVDHFEKRIVWTDARSDAIYSALYDGSSMIEIIRGHEYLSHPFAVSLYGSEVYWTDWRTNTLSKANKWTGQNVSVIQKTSAQPFDLQIYHPSRQPQAFTVPDIDDVTVVDFDAAEERLYWTDVKTQTIKRAFINGTGLETVISRDIQIIRGLAVDWLSRNLYWISSEFDETQINVAHLDGSLKTSIIHGIDKPQCLAVHPAKG